MKYSALIIIIAIVSKIMKEVVLNYRKDIIYISTQNN